VNCPFDADDAPLFWALAFTIEASGFQTRFALETNDSSETRAEKLPTVVPQGGAGPRL
jgi:hypothetical protein